MATKKKHAKWTYARVSAPEPTTRATLKAGETHLGSCTYWLLSEKSREKADQVMIAIEEEARKLGYEIEEL